MGYELLDQGIDAAEELITNILKHKHYDYTPHKLKIAKHYIDYLWCGNWDTTLYFDNMPSIRFMQEDEYDQHMDEPRPDYDFLSSGCHYIAIGD
jgi:hypothetical protein